YSQFSSTKDIPDLHQPVLAATGQACVVGRPAHTGDRVRVPSEGEDFLASLSVPDLHRAVLAAAGQAQTVGAETDALDRGIMLEQIQLQFHGAPQHPVILPARQVRIAAVQDGTCPLEVSPVDLLLRQAQLETVTDRSRP